MVQHELSVLPGFEHTNRYWDPYRSMMVAKVNPGDYYLSRGEEMLVTTMGTSCGVYLHDTKSRVSGVLHFMLPPSGGGSERIEFVETLVYDLLIHGFRRAGGQLHHAKAMIFAGDRDDANMELRSDAVSGYRIAKQLIGETRMPIEESIRSAGCPIKVYLDGTTGQVNWRFLSTYNDTIRSRESDHLGRLVGYLNHASYAFDYVTHPQEVQMAAN